MTFTREQIKSAYKKLPPGVQDFVMDNETTELITQYLKEAGLSEEQNNLADSEILYAMFGLQSPYDTIGNISKLSGKPTKELMSLKANLEKNIFSKISKELDAIEKQIDENDKPTPTQNNVGTEFEQIILNQAKAMKPAVPANLPTGGNEPRKVHDYKSGADPYREPPV